MRSYGELKTAVADYLNREDLSGEIANFVRLAEVKIYRALRVRDTEFVYEIVPDLVGPPVVDPINPIQLPDNYREMKLVVVNGIVIEPVSDQKFYELRMAWGSATPPDARQVQMGVYTVIDRKMHIWPWPEETPDDWGDTTISIRYYGTEHLADLSVWSTTDVPTSTPPAQGVPVYNEQPDSNATRLFEMNPDAYLYGALAEASLYLKKPEEAQHWGALFSGAITSLKAEHKHAQYSGGTMSINSAYGVGGNYARRNG